MSLEGPSRWLAVLLLGLAPTAWAQGGDPPESDTINYKFPEQGIELEQAIEWASRDTDRTFKYNQAEIRNKTFVMKGTVDIPRSRAYEFWQALFLTANFAMVPIGPDGGDFVQLESIDSSRNLKQRATFVPVDQLEQYRYRVGEVIMTTIALENVKVENVRGAVGQIFANRQTEFAQEVPSANALIVVGFAPTIYAVNQILEAMDVPAVAQTLKFEKIALTHAVAEELQPIISDLITTGQGNPAVARQPVAGGQPLIPGAESPEPKLIADPRTNSLVIYAVEPDLNEIKRLVGALDTEITEIESNIRMYRLENTNASDVERVLRDLLGQSQPRTARGPGGQQQTSIGERSSEVTIVADDSTNSLLIQATRTRYDQIKPIIAELDRRRPQVLVETAIVELSESDLRSIAVELTAVQGDADPYGVGAGTGFGLSTISPVGDPAATTSGIFGGVARVPFGIDQTNGGSFNGLVAGIFDEDFNIPLLLQMLETYQRSNLLSNASVLTSDNEEAEISVGRTVFFQEFSQTQAGTDRTSATDAEAALTLTISPHISSDKYLRLDIDLIVDAFVGTFDPATGVPPPQTNRSYRGTVTVANGKTVVIGGLVQENDSETENKVPWLGDIPLLGELFKSSSTSQERTTLYLFVTPTIITDFEQLDEISYEKKLEVYKLNAAISLVDENFRVIDIEDTEIDLDAIDDAGFLDVPRFNPVSQLDNQERFDTVRGIPVSPQAGAAKPRTTLRRSGTIEFRGGRPVFENDPDARGNNR